MAYRSQTELSPPPAYNYDQPTEMGEKYKDGPEVVTSEPRQMQMTNPLIYPPVVNQQPAPMSQTTVNIHNVPVVQHVGPRVWSSTAFDCCDDMATCCCGLFCSGCLAGSIASKMGESMCVPCMVPGGTIALRSVLRTRYNIQGSILDDCLMAVFCHQCMLCQMDREMKFLSYTTPIRPAVVM